MHLLLPSHPYLLSGDQWEYQKWVTKYIYSISEHFCFISPFRSVGSPWGPRGGSRGSPGKRGIIYFHYTSIHKEHNGKMCDYFDHRFHTLCVMKHLKSKFSSDGEPWDKIKWGSVVVSFLGVLDAKKFGNHWVGPIYRTGFMCKYVINSKSIFFYYCF